MHRKTYTQAKRQRFRGAIYFWSVVLLVSCARKQASGLEEKETSHLTTATQTVGGQSVPQAADTKPVEAPPPPNTRVVPRKEEDGPDALIRQARICAKEERWGDAVSVLEKARKQFPDNTTVLGELGWAAFKDDRRSLAEETSLRAVELESRPKVKAAYLYNLGRIAELYNDPLDTIDYYRQSSALRPNGVVEKRLAELISKLQPTGGNGWAVYDMNSKLFYHHGRIISPACVTGVTGCGGPYPPNEPIELSGCQQLAEAVKFEEGKIILHQDDEAPGAYDEYEILAHNGDQFLIHSCCNGGGTGHFEDLFIASLKDDRLTRVLGINGGDRCYRGLMSVEPLPEENRVRYNYAVCAKDILDFDSIGRTLPVENCEDVNCSALCCLGEARMAYDFSTHARTFLGIELDGSDLPELDDYDKKKFRYQACFNSLLREETETAGGHVILTPEKLSNFAALFSKKCLKQ